MSGRGVYTFKVIVSTLTLKSYYFNILYFKYLNITFDFRVATAMKVKF